MVIGGISNGGGDGGGGCTGVCSRDGFTITLPHHTDEMGA